MQEHMTFLEYVMGGHPLLWIETPEEVRMLRSHIADLSKFKEPFDIYSWDCVDGVRPWMSNKHCFGATVKWSEDPEGEAVELTSPIAALKWMDQEAGRKLKMQDEHGAEKTVLGNCVVFFKDLHPFIDVDLAGGKAHQVIRQIRNLAYGSALPFEACGKVIAIVSPVVKIPTELSKELIVIPFSLPDRDGQKGILKLTSDEQGAPYPEDDEPVVDALLGMTEIEGKNALSMSLIKAKCFDPKVIRTEKSNIIKKDGILEVVETDLTMDDIGGLEILKQTLEDWKGCFGEKARAFGLPNPRGLFLGGIAGCGKSLTSKCVASAWGRPLLRLDLGAVFDKWVGNSEGKIRQVFSTAEAMAPCVLWIDEIEKSLTGDHEVTKRVKSTMLTWMQEHTADVFLTATANEVHLLDAALLRRFNYFFWVDLPAPEQRAEIIRIQLKRAKRKTDLFDKDMALLEELSDGFNGSGIEDWLGKALLRAFNRNADEVAVEDMVATASDVTRISELNREEIATARKWAHDHQAKPASAAFSQPIEKAVESVSKKRKLIQE